MTSDTMTKRYVTQTQFDRLADWSMRKPVIALMGEFSSGKSTLMNLLIGQDILPTQVTATRLPPVWLTYGTDAPYRMDHNGRKHKVNLKNHDSIPIRTTSYIRLFIEADILKQCDLIDTPGISDPSIKMEYWIRTIRYANAVMWCTHAGQAWRESERGAWESLPARLRETSILLVTRKDKITSERDLLKIQRRLERETQDLFNTRMFISLTNALKAVEQKDDEAWEKSGGKDFKEMLEKIVEGIYVQRSYMLSRYVVGTAPAVQPPQPDAQEPAIPAASAGMESAAENGADTEARNGVAADAPDMNDYRLSNLKAYHENYSNVSLSDYRLKNPSLYGAAEPRNSAPTPSVSESRNEAPAGTSRTEKIRAVCAQIRKQYDMPKTAAPSQAAEDVVDEMNEDAAVIRQARETV